MNPLSTDAPHQAPRFRWFSMGVLIAALYFVGSIWVYSAPLKPGEKPMRVGDLLIALATYVFLAAAWQYARYRLFKAAVSKGKYLIGPPSYLPKILGFPFRVLSSLLPDPPTVHTGSRGGQYTVDRKGNKKYKHRH